MESRDRWLQRAQPDVHETTQTRMRMEKVVQVLLAGEIAQRRYAPRSARSWHGLSDRQKAIDLLTRLVEPANEKAFRAYFTLLYESAKTMVAVRWGWIEAIAHELLERLTVSGREVLGVIHVYTGLAGKIAVQDHEVEEVKL